MTLGEIKSQFLGLVNRTDLRANTALQTTFINQGLLRVARELRIPAMEKSILVTAGSTFSGIAIPPDFLQLINIEISTADESYSLKRDMLMRVKSQAYNTGMPLTYARQGSNFIIGPKPAQGEALRVDYYSDAAFTALVDDEDTSIISEVAWDAVVYAACCAAADYFADKRLPAWEARFAQIMDALDEQADGDELTANAAVSPAYSFPEDR